MICIIAATIEAAWRKYASGNKATIGSDIGLLPVRRHVVIWTSVGLLLLLDCWKHVSVKFESEYNHFLTRKLLFKHLMACQRFSESIDAVHYVNIVMISRGYRMHPCVMSHWWESTFNLVQAAPAQCMWERKSRILQSIVFMKHVLTIAISRQMVQFYAANESTSFKRL